MAIYEYLCECGYKFEQIRPMSESTKDSECEVCHKIAKRIFSLPSPGGAPPEVWEYDYTHAVKPKYVRDSKGNKLKFNPNTMRKGRKGTG